LLQQETVGENFWSASAQCDDRVASAEGVCDCVGFEAAEGIFAMGAEDFRDGGAVPFFQQGVYIEKIPMEGGCKPTARSALTGSHKAGEDDALELRWKRCRHDG